VPTPQDEDDHRHRAAARLYADAFAAAPRLVDDLNAKHRYYAARATAQSGCGRGTDAAGAEETERARWRRQAREWLRADLAAWVRLLDGDPATARWIVSKMSRVLNAEGIEGVALRYGFFYGPGTWYCPEGAAANQVRRREIPIIGAGEGVWSWVHIEDAGVATVAARTARRACTTSSMTTRPRSAAGSRRSRGGSGPRPR
jgi:hypothetical protein